MVDHFPKTTTVRPCKEDEFIELVAVLMNAFHDKFQVFLKGVPEGERAPLLAGLFDIAHATDKPLEGHLVAEVDGVLAGGARLVAPGDRAPDKGASFTYLRRNIGFWKAVRTGLFLERFTLKKVEGDELYIDAIGVKKKFRGTGIGTTLLGEIEKAAKDRGLSRLTLYVACTNPRAEALYERIGFTRTGIKRSRVSGWLLGIPAFHFMEKPVGRDISTT